MKHNYASLPLFLVFLGTFAPGRALAQDARAEVLIPDGGAASASDAGAPDTARVPSPPPLSAPPPTARPAPRVVAAPAPPPAAPVRASDLEQFRPWSLSPEGISTASYVQLQYESHQDSHNQLFQGGALQNKDRFVVRRARLSTIGEWQYAAMVVELDANTVLGPEVDLKKAEGSLQYRPNRTKPPLFIATAGLFDTPFGYELVEVPRTRWFMEQTTAARALWPGSSDVGVRVAGALGFFRWTISALNGHPQSEVSGYALQDPDAAKDLAVRFGVDVAARDDLQIAGDISSSRGKGFHPGTDATKPSVQWTDANRDGVLQANELMGIPGQAAIPSQTFDRSALGADLRICFRSRLGFTKAYAEVVVATNMDRGLFVADPIVTGVDQRELGYYAGLVQELGRHAVVGFRYDVYDPNANAFDTRRATLLPYSQAITTYAPLVALTLPGRARLVFEYDFVTNALGRDARGVPASLAIDTWTLRLQVEQ